MHSGLRQQITDLTAQWNKTFIGKNSVWADSNYAWRSIGIVRSGRVVALPLPPEEPDLTFDEMVDLRKDEIVVKRRETEEIRAKVYREELTIAAVSCLVIVAIGLFFFL